MAIKNEKSSTENEPNHNNNKNRSKPSEGNKLNNIFSFRI